MLTAIATPGHTPGALSWRWVSCDGGVCRTIVYADSLTPVSSTTYRFSDHPAYLAAFRASIAKIAASPCEILLTPHPSASDMPHRLALGEPLFDPDACQNYAAQLTQAARRAAGEGSRRQVSFRVTVPCTRAQGEAIADADDLFPRATIRRCSSPTSPIRPARRVADPRLFRARAERATRSRC